MTSQLNVDTIVDKAGSGGSNVKMANTSTYVGEGGSGTQNTVQGLGKVFINFNGTGTIATSDSFNHSSLTDHATGQYSNTISSAMGNITYAGQANGGEVGSRDCHTMFPATSNFTTTVQRVRLAPSNNADGNHDASVICITINGDLA